MVGDGRQGLKVLYPSPEERATGSSGTGFEYVHDPPDVRTHINNIGTVLSLSMGLVLARSIPGMVWTPIGRATCSQQPFPRAV